MIVGLRVRYVAFVVTCLLQASCTSEAATAETTKTVTIYVDASRMLSIACHAATNGSCQVIVDDKGVRQTVRLAVGGGRTIAHVSPDARTCTIGTRSTIRDCSWVPVTPAS